MKSKVGAKLTSAEKDQKEKLLSTLRKQKKRGFARHVFLQAFAIAVGISLVNIFIDLNLRTYIVFSTVFLITALLMWANWLELDNRINHLEHEIFQKKILKKTKGLRVPHFVIFVVASAIFVSPLLLQGKIKSWEAELSKTRNLKLVENFNSKQLEKLVELSIEDSGGREVVLKVSQAYLSFGSSFNRVINISDFTSETQHFLATALPNLEPWKISEEILLRLQMRNNLDSPRWDARSTVDKILQVDGSFVGVSISSFLPFSYENVMSIYSGLLKTKMSDPVLKNEYGLNLYYGEIKVPGEIKGQKVSVYRKGFVAVPTNVTNYPPMIFYCTNTCTIISSYEGKLGLMLNFHAANLRDWREIWKKLQIKLKNMG